MIIDLRMFVLSSLFGIYLQFWLIYTVYSLQFVIPKVIPASAVDSVCFIDVSVALFKCVSSQGSVLTSLSKFYGKMKLFGRIIKFNIRHRSANLL